MKTETPKAPKHLRLATRRWFEAVAADWELEAHHVRLLQLACEAWDRGQQAREQIARDGLTSPTREGGQKLSPLVRIENDCRLAFARLLRELDLDIAGPAAESKRPPMLRSIRGGQPYAS
jgi:P27 family predicted phage terminase small subunit